MWHNLERVQKKLDKQIKKAPKEMDGTHKRNS